MPNKWLDPEFAENWDAKTNNRNPIRLEQLDIVASVVADTYQEGKYVVDLGFGSGHLEEMILKRRPETRLIGIDASSAMIDIANSRLVPLSKAYQAIQHDLSDISSLHLDGEDIQVILCIQTLHHLAQEHQIKVLKWAHNTLDKGGVFLIIDRIAIDTKTFFDTYKSLWKRLDNASPQSNEDFDHYVKKITTKQDYPFTIEQNLDHLRRAGFEATCIHLHLDRAIIVARKH